MRDMSEEDESAERTIQGKSHKRANLNQSKWQRKCNALEQKVQRGSNWQLRLKLSYQFDLAQVGQTDGQKGQKKIGLWSHKSCGTVITSLPPSCAQFAELGEKVWKTSVIMVSLLMLKKSEEGPAYSWCFFKTTYRHCSVHGCFPSTKMNA